MHRARPDHRARHVTFRRLRQMRYRTTIIGSAFVFIAVAARWVVRAFAASSRASEGVIHVVSQQPLPGQTGTDVTILTVDYSPGGSTPPHQQPGTTYAYVLQGSVISQVNDGRPDSNVRNRTDVDRAAARSSWAGRLEDVEFLHVCPIWSLCHPRTA